MALFIPLVSGLAVGYLAAKAGSAEAGVVKPVARTIVKTGSRVANTVRSFAEGIKEDIEDASAEAMADDSAASDTGKTKTTAKPKPKD